ncbi:hypothetical protein A2W24_03140 [Microgenomates group bacterium RBG_16_45_19]|nr:MAG: hypothetical protein A2W24_03140 [Microgenomates group bacterium RBG_16_45_19]
MRLIIEDTKHLNLAQDLLWVGTFTLVTVIIWIVYGVYVTFTKPYPDSDTSQLLTPLNPTLDQEMLHNLSQRFAPPSDLVILVKSEAGAVQALGSPPNQSASVSAAVPTPLVSTSSALFAF